MNAWQAAEGGAEVGQYAWVAGEDLFIGDVMAALRDALGNTLAGKPGRYEPDEAEEGGVAGVGGALEEGEFVADGIGEDGLEDEALALAEEYVADGSGDAGCFVGVHTEFAGDVVGVDQAQGGGFEMGVIEGGLAGSVGPGEGDHDGPLVKWGSHCLARRGS